MANGRFKILFEEHNLQTQIFVSLYVLLFFVVVKCVREPCPQRTRVFLSRLSPLPSIIVSGPSVSIHIHPVSLFPPLRSRALTVPLRQECASRAVPVDAAHPPRRARRSGRRAHRDGRAAVACARIGARCD